MTLRDTSLDIREESIYRLLGRSAAGTPRLSQDSKSLRYEIDVNPDDPLAVSVVSQIRRGDVDGSSFVRGRSQR